MAPNCSGHSISSPKYCSIFVFCPPANRVLFQQACTLLLLLFARKATASDASVPYDQVLATQFDADGKVLWHNTIQKKGTKNNLKGTVATHTIDDRSYLLFASSIQNGEKARLWPHCAQLDAKGNVREDWVSMRGDQMDRMCPLYSAGSGKHINMLFWWSNRVQLASFQLEF